MQEKDLTSLGVEPFQDLYNSINIFISAYTRLHPTIYPQEQHALDALQRIAQDVQGLLSAHQPEICTEQQYQQFIADIREIVPGEKIVVTTSTAGYLFGWGAATIRTEVDSKLAVKIKAFISTLLDSLAQAKLKNPGTKPGTVSDEAARQPAVNDDFRKELEILRLELKNQLQETTEKAQLAYAEAQLAKLQAKTAMEQAEAYKKQLALVDQQIQLARPIILNLGRVDADLAQKLANIFQFSLPAESAVTETRQVKEPRTSISATPQLFAQAQIESAITAMPLPEKYQVIAPPADEKARKQWLESSVANKIAYDKYKLSRIVSEATRATLFECLDFWRAHQADSQLAAVMRSTIDFLIDQYDKPWQQNWPVLEEKLGCSNSTRPLMHLLESFAALDDTFPAQRAAAAPAILAKLYTDGHYLPKDPERKQQFMRMLKN